MLYQHRYKKHNYYIERIEQMTTNDRLFSLRREKGNRKDKIITFYEPVNVMDRETGAIVVKWRKLFDCKAYVRQVGANEYMYDNMDINFEDRIFMINYREEGLSTNNRIVYKNKMYEIKKIDTFEDNRRDDILILGNVFTK